MMMCTIEIEAFQHNGCLKETETFLAGRPMPGLYKTQSGWKINWGNCEVSIKAVSGWQRVNLGDWVLKARGMMWRVDNQEFREVYAKQAQCVEEKP